jgi:SPP1 gp7 family putative phage head morphogenesis protein
VADNRNYVLTTVKDMLQSALEGGLSIEDFTNDLFGYFNRAGVTLRNPYYYDLVFINNIQESLNRGKDEIFNEADGDEFPLMQFFTVGDDRVRQEHAVLDGFAWPKNDPVWQRLKPPLDHGCRCGRSLVHKDEDVKPSSQARYNKVLSVSRGRGFGFVN